MTRPSFDDIALELATAIAKRSTCPRLHTAALIVTSNDRLIASGYNGSLPGQQHCDEVYTCPACKGVGQRHPGIAWCSACDGRTDWLPPNCLIVDGHCQRTVHAEANAIAQAARHGISVAACKMYCLHTPCIICAKLVISSGISEFIVFNEYTNTPLKEVMDFIKQAGVRYTTYRTH
jgi:dCMP deaminase